MNKSKFDPAKPYNDLPELPPVGVELETPKVLKSLVSARAALAEVKQAINRLPNPGILINSIGLREAQLSSEIENIVTSSDELYRAFSDQGQRTDPQTKEVLSYREALAYGRGELRKGRPLATRMYEEIVKIIRETDEGVRKIPGTTIRNEATGDVIYTPPVGELVIRSKLAQLEKFFYDRESSLDPLVVIALCHYQFEAIHPFSDGNGRTGRLLVLLYLVELGLIAEPVLFISRYILKNRTEYYAGLRAITERGDWENWILYILAALTDSAQDSLRRVDEICALQQKAAELIQTKLPKLYSFDLVQLLFQHPYTKIRFLEEAGLAKRQTASKYLEEISRLGILEIVEIGRDKYYINSGLVEVLQQG